MKIFSFSNKVSSSISNEMNPKAVSLVLTFLSSLYLLNYRLMISISTNTIEFSSKPIGIFIVKSSDTSHFYEEHLSSLACYAHRHSYEFILIEIEQYPICKNLSRSITFEKHCLVWMYLLENIHIQWLLVLDMDILVLNLSKNIESYLPSTTHDSDIHLILYEKFTGEIASGNYLIHNHPWSHLFLQRWMDYQRYIPYLKFANNDNGVLHIHLLHPMVTQVNQSMTKQCFDIYKGASELRVYHNYVACCKCALNGRWEFQHLKILRRAHSFIRDNLGHYMSQTIWSPTDFLLRGQIHHIEQYYSEKINRTACRNPEWTLPIKENSIIQNLTQMKEIIALFDLAAAQGYPQSVGLPDITDCWPLCQENQTKRQAFLKKVCHHNAPWRFTH